MIEAVHGLNNRKIHKQKRTKINKSSYSPRTFQIKIKYLCLTDNVKNIIITSNLCKQRSKCEKLTRGISHR